MSKKDKKPLLIAGNNITAKAKSATFWTGFVPVLATFIVSVCSLLGIKGAEDIVNQGTAIAGVVISFLTGLGVLVSHDTKGIADSPIVQDFNKPRDYNDPDKALTYKSEAMNSTSELPPTKMPMAPEGVNNEDIDTSHAEPLEHGKIEKDLVSELDKEDNPKEVGEQ
ncbi:holin [Staphylococcus phage Stau2]|uniref:HolTW n=1 Tax=Staphylococcus phage Stau2 TaxID=1200862 RepID=A0A0U1ZW55_9CAUD|nr:holin [Staphylococcus phage Stau2]AKA61428.1 holTW [Staphylococcus phage Stau2]